MRILVTCDRYPGNLSDGLTLRVFHYVRRLRDRHAFDLVCFDDVSAVEHGSDELFDRVTRVPRPVERPPQGALARLFDAFDPRSLYPVSGEAARQIRELVDTNHYDLIWDAGCNMLRNLGAGRKRGIPLLADQVDDSFLRLARDFSGARSLYPRLWFAKQYVLQWLFVIWYLGNAQRVLLVSEADARSLKRHVPWAKCSVIENGVDEEYFAAETLEDRSTARSRREIVFEGSMSFEPNVDAALYLANEIFPLIRARVPDARLILVGRSPTPDILALGCDHVEVTGTVPDVRPYLSAERVFVCPMRKGAGIKNKILQAWSMSMPVVSTSAGVGSMKAVNGRDLIIRDEPSAFAEAVVDLFKNEPAARELGQAGRANIIRHYTWAKKAAEFDRLIRSISHSGTAA
jgi:polysaccharide biosynthesis protein PslH